MFTRSFHIYEDPSLTPNTTTTTSTTNLSMLMKDRMNHFSLDRKTNGQEILVVPNFNQGEEHDDDR